MDITTKMMLDGNVVAGTLQAIFGVKMTATCRILAEYGGTSMISELRAFTNHLA